MKLSLIANRPPRGEFDTAYEATFTQVSRDENERIEEETIEAGDHCGIFGTFDLELMFDAGWRAALAQQAPNLSFDALYQKLFTADVRSRESLGRTIEGATFFKADLEAVFQGALAQQALCEACKIEGRPDSFVCEHCAALAQQAQPHVGEGRSLPSAPLGNLCTTCYKPMPCWVHSAQQAQPLCDNPEPHAAHKTMVADAGGPIIAACAGAQQAQPLTDEVIEAEADHRGLGVGPDAFVWKQGAQWARDRMAQQAQPEPMKADRLSLGNAIINGLPGAFSYADTRPFRLAEALLKDYDVTVKRETIEREITAINERT